MCGLAGVLAFNDFQITPEYLINMRDTMIHRGPDGAGMWISPDAPIGLAHRRLSIIDLSNQAAQPMSNDDDTIWITFNGEIYNHEELRKELNQLSNIHWKTSHSDTEVLIQAYEVWGISFIKKLRGMFAFALWDGRQNVLWLVRDRLGIKPLYYSLHHNRLTFASEIKALLQDPEQERAVDEKSFFNYLSFLTTPAPDTLFKGIHKLPAATWMRVQLNGKIETFQYWDVFDNPVDLDGKSEEQIAEQLLDELRTSVQCHGLSDVPVGVFLSGGIDSSTNAALFAQSTISQISTFTIGYQGNYASCKNELEYAHIAADHAGALYHERLLDENDLLNFLPTMVTLQDEPIADPVCVPVYYVSKLARDNKRIVCQVGEGADELFWGYPSWKIKLRLQQLSQIPGTTWLKKAGLCALKGLHKESSLEYELLTRGAKSLPVFWGGAEAFTAVEKHRLLSDRLKKRFEGYSAWDALAPIYQRFRTQADNQHPLNWMSYLDLNFRLPELLLMRVDKMSMGASVECRVPFLDHRFVEFAMSIPPSLKTKNGTLKYILKKAVQGVIPDQLINRPKQGFGVPVAEWLMTGLGRQTRKTLERFCAATDFLDQKEVMRYLDQGHNAKVWYLLNFALWWERYIDKGTA